MDTKVTQKIVKGNFTEEYILEKVGRGIVKFTQKNETGCPGQTQEIYLNEFQLKFINEHFKNVVGG